MGVSPIRHTSDEEETAAIRRAQAKAKALARASGAAGSGAPAAAQLGYESEESDEEQTAAILRAQAKAKALTTASAAAGSGTRPSRLRWSDEVGSALVSACAEVRRADSAAAAVAPRTELARLAQQHTALRLGTQASVLRSVGRRVEVVGDGSCWAYAVLAAMGWLQHGGGSVPTLRDRRFVTRMRHMVASWFALPQNAARRADELLLNGAWAAFRERTLRDPTFDASGRCTRQGGWGGTAAFLAVASRWNIDVVCWDERQLSGRGTVRVVRPGGTHSVPLDVVRVGDCCNARCDRLQRSILCDKHLYSIDDKGGRRRLVHVVYNGKDHYAAMDEAGWRREPPHCTIADVDES